VNRLAHGVPVNVDDLLEIESLRSTITAAFATTPRPRGTEISASTCPEGAEIAAYFRGKSWRGHTPRQLREVSAALSFFTPKAFRHYVAAYMLAELEDPETADVIAGSVQFNLSVSAGPAGDLNAAALSPSEREAVAAFLRFCGRRYGNADFTQTAERLSQLGD
jgi:hypothetical protein